MNQRVHTGGEIVEYLLGSLPEDRMEAIEQRILTDDDFHLEVEAAETELLDKYVYGELDDRSRGLFQQNFLKSELRRRKLRFALALKEKLATEKPVTPRRPLRSHALVASLLLAAGLGLANLYSLRRLSREQAQVADLNRQIVTMRNSAGTQSEGSSQDPIVVAKLEKPYTRGDEMSEIKVLSGVRRVQLQLNVPAALQGKAQVRFLDDSRRPVITRSGVPQEIGGKRVLVVNLRSQDLPSANYFIEITGEGPSSTRVTYAVKVLGQ